MINLLGRTTEEIQQILVDMGEPAYRGRQVADWIYRRTLPGQGGGALASFAGMNDIPSALRQKLAELYMLDMTEVVETAHDGRDGTVKVVTALFDGPKVEAVLMPDIRRVSVCLSTQAGCPMACTFCATGTMGLARNLTAAEVLAQFLRLQETTERRISHVVFMGMGEPLLNYAETVRAIQILNREIGVAMRHITLSTVGIVPAIDKLAAEKLQLTLAVSLHAPNDALRTSIVPVHATYGMERLIKSCRNYFEATGRRVTFEYILLKGVNDNPQEASELVKLLRNFPCAVNLIPYNPTKVAMLFERPESSRIFAFRKILEDGGLAVTQRKERGQQIAAACGQLATQERYRPSPTARSLPLADVELAGASA